MEIALLVGMIVSAIIIYFALVVHSSSIDPSDEKKISIKDDSLVLRLLFKKPWAPILWIYWPIVFVLARISTRVFPALVCISGIGFVLWLALDGILFQCELKKLYSRYPETFEKVLCPREIVEDSIYLRWEDPDICEVTDVRFFMRTVIPQSPDDEWRWEPLWRDNDNVTKEIGCITAHFGTPEWLNYTYEILPIIVSDNRPSKTPIKNYDYTGDRPVKSYRYGDRRLLFMCSVYDKQGNLQGRYEGSVIVERDIYDRVTRYRDAKRDWTSDPRLGELYDRLLKLAPSVVEMYADYDIREWVADGKCKLLIW